MLRIRHRRYSAVPGKPSTALDHVKLIGWIGFTLILMYIITLLPTLMPFCVSEKQTETSVTIGFAAVALLLIVAGGSGMILAALKLGFGRQVFHWILLAGGVIVIIFGLPYLGLEKVEITKEGCSARTWFGLSSTHLRFAELEQFKHTQQPLNPNAWRSGKGPRPGKMEYVTKGGEEGVFYSSYYPTAVYNRAMGQLLLAWALHRKGLEYPVKR